VVGTAEKIIERFYGRRHTHVEKMGTLDPRRLAV
jgi:hypothetical protein